VEGGDLHFQNMYLLMEMLCAVELLHQGYRAEPNGDMDAYDAGRLYLLPLCFALNRSQYAPAIIKELGMVYHCAPDALRWQRRDSFAPGSWAWDLHVEYFNKCQKAVMSANSVPTANLITRSALLVGHMQEVDKQLRENLNMGDVKPRSKHSNGDMSPDVALMFKHMAVKGTLRIVEGRKKCMDISMEAEIMSKRTPVELMKYGLEEMKKFIPPFLEGKIPKFPTPIILSDAKEQDIADRADKRAAAAQARRVAKEGGGVGEGIGAVEAAAEAAGAAATAAAAGAIAAVEAAGAAVLAVGVGAVAAVEAAGSAAAAAGVGAVSTGFGFLSAVVAATGAASADDDEADAVHVSADA
jgi:hypothetical protein